MVSHMLRLYRFLSRFLLLDDVSRTAPTDGQVYVWDATTSTFIPHTLTMGDVATLTDPQVGDVLTFDGAAWVNTAP